MWLAIVGVWSRLENYEQDPLVAGHVQSKLRYERPIVAFYLPINLQFVRSQRYL